MKIAGKNICDPYRKSNLLDNTFNLKHENESNLQFFLIFI